MRRRASRSLRYAVGVVVLVALVVSAAQSAAGSGRRPKGPPQARIVHVTIDPLLRTVVLHFGRAGRGSLRGYQCSATPTGTAPRYADCRPPERYGRLDPGHYTFRVRAIGPQSSVSPPATRTEDVPIEFSRCWGAASRDQRRPCHNPALGGLVVPTPSQALLEPVAYCHDIRTEDGVQMCTFGVKPAIATEHVALIGDSHGAAMGRAMKYVAKHERWVGTAIIHNGCGFSTALRSDLPTSEADDCESWRAGITRWLQGHPDVTSVFITGNDAWRYLTSAAVGFDDAWAALPSSVHSIYVIRDSPHELLREPNCVSHGIAHHLRDIGERCSVPRSEVLSPDAEAQAAAHSGSPRVHLIDLWPFFCGARCFPVIGGVLVLSDLQHVDPEFAATLGPYILRAIHSR